jgi:hypothetical protein
LPVNGPWTFNAPQYVGILYTAFKLNHSSLTPCSRALQRNSKELSSLHGHPILYCLLLKSHALGPEHCHALHHPQYINLTPNFTAFVTAHGKTKAYLHRFKIIESPECPCGGASQTIDHLLFDCTVIQNERELLIGKISKQDNWPISKNQLVNKHIKHFLQFTNTIDFTKL